MNQKSNFLITLILGMTTGWAMGFLRFPFLQKNAAFGVGFLAGIAVVLLVILLLMVWKKNALLPGSIGEKPESLGLETATNTYTGLWVLVSLFILAGGMISSFLIFKQNKWLEVQAMQQQQQVETQTALLETMKTNNQALLINVFLDKINDELLGNPARKLSDAAIGRIAALSAAFQPYPADAVADSLPSGALSYERGQLLRGLSRMKMDSSSFSKIKQSTTFSHADLQDADFSNMDLSGADLRKARLVRANLQNTNLSRTRMRRADLKWANLTEAILDSAMLKAADFRDATLLKTDFRKANLQWANFEGALLRDASLKGSNLLGATLHKAILHKTDFTDANVYSIHVGKDWLENLSEWQVIGAEKIREIYRNIPSKPKKGEQVKYRLWKK